MMCLFLFVILMTGDSVETLGGCNTVLKVQCDYAAITLALTIRRAF